MVVLLLNQPSYVNARINVHYIQQNISFVLAPTVFDLIIIIVLRFVAFIADNI